MSESREKSTDEDSRRNCALSRVYVKARELADRVIRIAALIDCPRFLREMIPRTALPPGATRLKHASKQERAPREESCEVVANQMYLLSNVDCAWRRTKPALE